MRREPLSPIAKFAIVVGALSVSILLLVFIARRPFDEPQDQAETASHSATLSPPDSGTHPSLIFGRVTTHDNATYEGRLQFGGNEEAFWGQYFNGSKAQNPWANYVPGQLTERVPFEILGLQVFSWRQEINLNRPFMARFGDIKRIESDGWNLQVTLKSGTLFELDLFEADDFADGLRVWDRTRGIVDLEEAQIRSIDFLEPNGEPGPVPGRLFGTVSSVAGRFSGFIEWGPRQSVGSDEFDGGPTGEFRLRFDRIGSIRPYLPATWLVTLLNGEDIVVSENRDVNRNTGIYVDDPRYGRVLIPWNAFTNVDFSAGGGAPAYGDFPAGGPLMGAVITRDGRHLAGRLVYDLDESETTETLDAASQGVLYNIPFGLIATITPPSDENPAGRVTLHTGEVLQLESDGDLGHANPGVLIFVGDGKRAEYVRWAGIQQIRFERPAATYPPLELRE